MTSREVKRVDLKSRPDLVLYVRALNFVEGVQLGKRLRDLSVALPDGQTVQPLSEDLVAEQFLAYVCDETGTPAFADREAALEFMKGLRPNQGQLILKTATAFNDLGDEQIEEAQKN